MNKVSVIVPVYNVEPWIEQCINSLKAQNFDGLECIVVDDESTDKSFEIANDLVSGDKRFRIARQKHSGLSVARNLGMDLSDSELVMHVDSDDYVLPNFAESAVSFLEENRLQMAFFNGNVINCGNSKHAFNIEQDYIHRRGFCGDGSGQELFCKMMQRNSYVYAVFLQIIRKDCIRHKFYDGILAQDKLYTTQNLLHLDRAGYLSDVLYIKRSHSNSSIASKRGIDLLYSRSRMFLEFEKYIEDYGCSLSNKTIYWLGIMLHRMWKGMNILWNRMNDDERSKICSLPPEIIALLQSILGDSWDSKECI